MEILALLAMPLATFGFIYIVRYTDGPFNMLKWFRTLIGFVYIENQIKGTYLEEVKPKFFAKLVNCPWCFATWVAAAFTALVLAFPGNLIITWAVLTFAGLGVSGVIHTWVMKQED